MSAIDVTPVARLPRQIPFIIGNEACERFSFYGMRNILVEFLARSAILAAVAPEFRNAEAKEVFHIFVMGVYFFPLLGGWLSDRFLGKYRTILWLSIVYCAGHALLAVSEGSKAGFYWGLFLIALGSGGIKPCVSAFVGEQFNQSNKHLARVVFDAFYWVINFGSFFASLLIPIVLARWGAAWAFGIPGILMALATLIFWLGRKRYVVEPPLPADPNALSRVVRTALSKGAKPGRLFAGLGVVSLIVFETLAILDAYRILFSDQAPRLGIAQFACLGLVTFLGFAGYGVALEIEAARGSHPDEDVDGVKAFLQVLVLFVPVSAFWSLFDQKASTWVIQGGAMELPSWLEKASQMQSLNPLLVMLLIPFNNIVVYPALGALGAKVTPLRKMTAGMVFVGFSWIIVGAIQLRIDGGAELSILWQALPYAFLTLGEVLISATGLEFAYSQAPAKMKGMVMSFWLLAATVGGLWVLLVNSAVKNERAIQAIKSTGIGVVSFQMFFFAGFAFLAALSFGLIARKTIVLDNYRKGS